MNKLDNPVWYALNESHANFGLDYKGVKFYKPDYCPFGSFTDVKNIEIGINEYAKLSNNFFVVGDRPSYGLSDLTLKNELICNQMVLEKPVIFNQIEEIVLLKEESLKDLIQLVNLVQPGYFKNDTPELGNYYGIYQGGKLVAVTGERMKMDSFTEVSAVVTHPDYVGKGYAKQLVSFVSNQIFEEDKTPFLHVATSNVGAVHLYSKLGFVTRRKMSFWNFIKNN